MDDDVITLLNSGLPADAVLTDPDVVASYAKSFS